MKELEARLGTADLMGRPFLELHLIFNSPGRNTIGLRAEKGGFKGSFSCRGGYRNGLGCH
jgi:hypothetical protein